MRVHRVMVVLAVCALLAGTAFAGTSIGEVKTKFINVTPGGSVTIIDHGVTHSTTAGVYNHLLQPYDLTAAQEAAKFPPYLQGSYGIPGGSLEGENIYATTPGTLQQYVYDSSKRKWVWEGTNTKYLGTFCADLEQVIGGGAIYVYDVYLPEDAPIGGTNPPGGMGTAKADDLRQLFGYYLPATPMSDRLAQALQTAVWEIINEETDHAYSLTKLNGHTYASYGSAVPWWVTQANDWLGHVWSNHDDALGGDLGVPDIGLRCIVNTTTQDFALVVPGVGSNPIPEPLTVLGIFVGLAAVGNYLRRRR